MKRIICYMQAFITWINNGVFVPHVMADVKFEPAIIVSWDDGFRVSDTLEHKECEKAQEAILITYKCIYCGATEQAWCSKKFYHEHFYKGEL